MPITLEKAAARIYFIGDTFAAKDRIKSLGAHWDGDRRAWWIGAKKEAEARALLQEIGAGFDLRNETDRLVRADQLDDAGKTAEAAALRKGAPREDPANIRLTGKGRYKGREYFAGAITKDGQRVRLLTLPDANGDYLDFWAPCAEVEQTKKYEPRTRWNGAYGRNSRQVEHHTTLGSISDFVRRQRDPETARGQCTECDHWGPRGETCTECHEGTHA